MTRFLYLNDSFSPRIENNRGDRGFVICLFLNYDFLGLDKISKSLSNLSIFNRYIAVVNKIIGKDP